MKSLFISITLMLILSTFCLNLSYAVNTLVMDTPLALINSQSNQKIAAQLAENRQLIVAIDQAIRSSSLSDKELAFYRAQLQNTADALNNDEALLTTEINTLQSLLQTYETDTLSQDNTNISTTQTETIIHKIETAKQNIAAGQKMLAEMRVLNNLATNLNKKINLLRLKLRKDRIFMKSKSLYQWQTWQNGWQVMHNTWIGLHTDFPTTLLLNFILSTFTLVLISLGYIFLIKKFLQWLYRKYLSTYQIPVVAKWNIQYLLIGLLPSLALQSVASYIIVQAPAGHSLLRGMSNVLDVLAFYLLINGLLSSLRWKLKKQDNTHAIIFRHLYYILIYLSLFVFVNNVQIFVFDEYSFADFMVEFVVLFNLCWGILLPVVLYKTLPKRIAIERSAKNHWYVMAYHKLRPVVLIAAALYPVLIFVGYLNLASNILINTLQTLLFFSLMLGAQRFCKAGVRYGHRKILCHKKQASHGQSICSSLWPYWAMVLINLLLSLLFLFIFLIIWGVHSTLLIDTLKNMLFNQVGHGSFALSNIFKAIFGFVVVSYLSKWIKKMMEKRILPYTVFDEGTRHAISTTAGYIGLALAIVVFVYALGINLTTITFIISGLSVGIGIGLQEVFKNFFAGFILLIERPIKVGDIIIYQNEYGIVKNIRLRATELESFNKAVYFIPNMELVFQTVINDLSVPISRSTIKVGVSYDNDPKQVSEILLKIAQSHSEVLSEPEATVLFNDFGDSAYLFELRVFTSTDERMRIASELRYEIVKAFKAQGVKIPYPQRDLHIISQSEDFRVREIKSKT